MSHDDSWIDRPVSINMIRDGEIESLVARSNGDIIIGGITLTDRQVDRILWLLSHLPPRPYAGTTRHRTEVTIHLDYEQKVID